MSRCEILLVRNMQDAFGYSCGKDSTEECSECGTAVCELHADPVNCAAQLYVPPASWDMPGNHTPNQQFRVLRRNPKGA